MSAEDTSGGLDAGFSIEECIARVRGGDSEAFEEIVRRYEGVVHRLALRMTGNRADALDVGQDAFLRIYRSLGRFKSGRRFESWVYRIVVNASWDHLRRQGKGPSVTMVGIENEAEGPEDPSHSRTPESEAASAQLREKLEVALGGLSPRLRAVFVLRDLEGLETSEISRILGCREVTVRRHSMQARERIRTILNKSYPGLAR